MASNVRSELYQLSAGRRAGLGRAVPVDPSPPLA